MTSHASPPRVLVVDDEPDLRTLYELTLLREGYEITTAGTLAEARDCLAAQQFQVLISDLRLPDGLGLELLREVAAAGRPERCIMITAYGSPENAVEALKSGAFDYLTKPVDLKQFRAVVRSALQAPEPPAPATAPAAPADKARSDEVPSPAAEYACSAAAPGPARQALARLVGESPAMRSVKSRIAKVARSMAPVLVHGESGTGKELVAGALHACSHRAEGPFVPVNCGAIPENLLEAEFFGARKGSYTGAAQDRVGFFQAAQGGTLFLDEIGDLPLSMQAKLLRAIQERRVRPLGATQEEAVDVRIVSATHKDLAAEVAAGRFRQDLYYRLNVIEIIIPPLRERRQDLPALCKALLKRIVADSGLPAPTISPEQLAEIYAAPLEGNVRELENLLHRALALGDGGADTMFGETLPPPLDSAPMPLLELPELIHPTSTAAAAPTASAAVCASPAPETDAAPLPSDLGAWLDEREREVLVRALQETNYNRTAAATLLGLNLRQIRYRMERLGINAPSGKDDAE